MEWKSKPTPDQNEWPEHLHACFPPFLFLSRSLTSLMGQHLDVGHVPLQIILLQSLSWPSVLPSLISQEGKEQRWGKGGRGVEEKEILRRQSPTLYLLGVRLLNGDPWKYLFSWSNGLAQNSQRQTQRRGLQGLGEGSCSTVKASVLGNVNVWETDAGDSHTTLWVSVMPLNCALEMVKMEKYVSVCVCIYILPQ